MNKYDKIWNDKAELFRKYIKELEIAPTTFTVYDGFELGKWLNTQISLYKRGKLSEDRIEVLNDIYPNWLNIKNSKTIINDITWECNAELLREFVWRYHRLPDYYYSCYKGFNLCGWINNQIKAFEDNKLSDHRIDVLNGISTDILNCHFREERWNFYAEVLKEYVNKYNKLPKVGKSYMHVRLGNWLGYQRYLLRNDKLLKVKKDALDNIYKNWEFSTNRDVIWNNHIELLKDYIKEFDKLPKYTERYKGINLGGWLNRQRIAFKNNKLSKYRKNILDNIYPDWLNTKK